MNCAKSAAIAPAICAMTKASKRQVFVFAYGHPSVGDLTGRSIDQNVS
jgi:hypothetical protein